MTNGTYYWRAYAADSVEWGLLGEVRSFIVDDVTATGGIVIGGPRLAVLGGGSGQAELQLTLPLATDLKVKIYNARGMLVRDLYSGAANAGTQVLTWDGRDRRGGQAASGVYFVRAVTSKEVLTDRVVMVR